MIENEEIQGYNHYNNFLQPIHRPSYEWTIGRYQYIFLPTSDPLHDIKFDDGLCYGISNKFIYCFDLYNIKDTLSYKHPLSYNNKKVQNSCFGSNQDIITLQYVNGFLQAQYTKNNTPLFHLPPSTFFFKSLHQHNIILALATDNKLRVIQSSSHQSIIPLSCSPLCADVVLSPNKILIGSVDGQVYAVCSNDNTIRVIVPTYGESPIRNICVVRNPASKFFVIGRENGSIESYSWNNHNGDAYFCSRYQHNHPIVFLKADVARVLSVDSYGCIKSGPLLGNQEPWFSVYIKSGISSIYMGSNQIAIGHSDNGLSILDFNKQINNP